MTSTTQNETLSISQTISRALRDAGYASYNSYAAPVVEALVARENDIAEKLVDYAVDAGADADEVKRYMREVGMIVAVTEPEDEVVEDDDDESAENDPSIRSMLRDIGTQLQSLTDFARSNGYRG